MSAMPNSPRRPRVDLAAELVRHFWRHRILIGATTLIAAALFAFILLLVPNKYRAEASIIILPPRFISEVRTEPLSVATAKTLLASGEIAQEVITTLRDARKLLTENLSIPTATQAAAFAETTPDAAMRALSISDRRLAGFIARLDDTEREALRNLPQAQFDDLSVDDMRKALESEDVVEKKTASDIKVSPLVRLYASAGINTMAQLLANTWAYLFEVKYDAITNEKTRRQFESIRQLQISSQQQLSDIQTTIVAYKSRHNLEVYLKLIDEHGINLRLYTSQLSLKRNALAQQEQQLDQLIAIREALEADGRFVGEVDIYETTESIAASLVNSETSDTREIFSSMRRQAITARQQLVAAGTEYSAYVSRNPVQLLESERNQAQTDYLKNTSRRSENEVTLSVLEDVVRELEQRIANTTPTLTLVKEVSDDAIASSLSRNNRGEIESLSRASFRYEAINPQWQEIVTEYNTLRSELTRRKSESGILDSSLPAVERRLRAIQSTIETARLGERIAANKLARWQKASEQISAGYVDTNTAIFDAARQIGLLQREVSQLTETTSETRALIDDNQRKYDESSAELLRLELQSRAVQRNADLLLQKFQEAQTAVAQQMSDVSIAARAVVPVKHVFPPRTVLLVAATFLTLLMLLALLGRQRYMELREAEED